MEEEDEMMKQMLKEKKTPKDIALDIHWRTYEAIKSRAQRFRTKNQNP
jgi:hypothetical protein